MRKRPGPHEGRCVNHTIEGPEHEGGDRSLHEEDPEANVVEFWDYCDRGNGRQV